jgi:predicted RNA-binding protein YlxR (DUF448 family)
MIAAFSGGVEELVAGNRRKHVPLRTCIACQGKRPKRELVRVVRTPEGFIEIDAKGKRPGRGAYLCLDLGCWDAALEQRKLGRALKCRVSAEDVARLRSAAASLLVGEAAVGTEIVLAKDEQVRVGLVD